MNWSKWVLGNLDHSCFLFGFLLPVTVERVENGKSGVNIEQSDFKVL